MSPLMAADPGFNTAFYSTAATVVPVLLVAAALQGDFIPTLLMLGARLGRRSRALSARARGHGLGREIVAGTGTFVVAYVLAVTGLMILIFALWGEYLSLQALLARHASTAADGVIGASLLVLIAAIGLAVVGRYAQLLREDLTREIKQAAPSPRKRTIRPTAQDRLPVPRSRRRLP